MRFYCCHLSALGSIEDRDMSNLKKNFIYNMVWQVLTLLFPLITTPYVSRVLGADGIGVYSFTYSIAYYFMLIAMLGINNHGNREVAKNRENRRKLSETFSSIYIIQLAASSTMVLAYVVYLTLFSPEFLPIAQVQIIYIISAMFDINWLFFGLEEFKLTVSRNIIIKLITIALIFILIQTPQDTWKYTIILAGSTLVSQLVMWPFALEKIKLYFPGKKAILKHVKPCLVLFIPLVAVSLYKVMDKIMLGMMTDVAEVGYYEQAEKITTMPLALVTALGTVMMPRMSNLASKGNEEGIKQYIEKSIKYMMFLAFPICLGLIAVANNFVPLFMGAGFDQSIILVKLLAVTILFLAFANTLRTGYIVPKEMDNVMVEFTIIGAVSNLVVNLMLIPNMRAVGACIGTIVAEFAVMLYQAFAVRKYLPVGKYFMMVLPFLAKALVMFCLVVPIEFLGLSPSLTVLLQISVGVVIYVVSNRHYISENIDLRKILGRRQNG